MHLKRLPMTMLPVLLSVFQSPESVVLAAGDVPTTPRWGTVSPALDPQLRDELLHMAQADQAARQPGHIDAKAMLAQRLQGDDWRSILTEDDRPPVDKRQPSQRADAIPMPRMVRALGDRSWARRNSARASS